MVKNQSYNVFTDYKNYFQKYEENPWELSKKLRIYWTALKLGVCAILNYPLGKRYIQLYYIR